MPQLCTYLCFVGILILVTIVVDPFAIATFVSIMYPSAVTFCSCFRMLFDPGEFHWMSCGA